MADFNEALRNRARGFAPGGVTPPAAPPADKRPAEDDAAAEAARLEAATAAVVEALAGSADKANGDAGSDKVEAAGTFDAREIAAAVLKAADKAAGKADDKPAGRDGTGYDAGKPGA